MDRRTLIVNGSAAAVATVAPLAVFAPKTQRVVVELLIGPISIRHDSHVAAYEKAMLPTLPARERLRSILGLGPADEIEIEYRRHSDGRYRYVTTKVVPGDTGERA